MKRFVLLILMCPVLFAQASYSPCDINHDGGINIVDVQLMINQALSLSACTADLDQNGKCDIIEVQREIVAALTGACTAGSAPSIVVTPATGSTVSGTTVFSADTSNAPTTASVEFDLGSLKLGVAAAPFSVSWNTAIAADGSYLVLAKAYDSTGAIVAQATTVVIISNHGGYIQVAGGADLSQPVSGTVPLSLTGYDGFGHYPGRWGVFLDGVEEFIHWSDNAGKNPNTISLSIDTTTVANGTHELHIEVGSDYWPPNLPQQGNVTWYDGTLGLNRIITVNNGHTLMGVTAGYQHVYLRPNQTLALTCTQLFTDNTRQPCASPSYSSSAPSTVAVDTSGLLVAGSNEGFATVTLTEAGKSGKAYVWVMNNPTIPHFSGNGQMLLSYQPGISIFPISPFVLDPPSVQGDASLNAEVKRAGINTLESGFYLNPRNTTQSYSSWQSNYDSIYGSRWTWAANNGYHLYTMGDDVARNIGSEAWFTLNWPSGQQAVQHAMESLAGSGVAIAIDMIDEGSSNWGSTPTPPRMIGDPGMFTSVTCTGPSCTVTWPNNPVQPGRLYFAGTSFALTGSVNANLNTPNGRIFSGTNVTTGSFDFVPAGPVTGVFTPSNDPHLEFLWWAGNAGGCPTAPCNPPVPNTALSSFAAWCRSANPHVPISWPALGIAPTNVHDNWAGKDSQVSDFMSHYWDTLQSEVTYKWASGVRELSSYMRNAFYQRQPFVRFDRPQVILGGISSYFYTKGANGAYFTPPQDTSIRPGSSAATTAAVMMTGAALGNSALRLYQFDNSASIAGRTSAPLGSQLQEGTNPFSGDQKAVQIWKSLGYVANALTKTLQPFLLSTPLSSPGLSDYIVTAARQGPTGTLLMVVNATDWSRTLTLDLTPYRTGNSITRYIVGPTEILTALIADAASDTVNLNEGETVVYLFPTSPTTRYLLPFPVSAPTLPAGATAAWLHQAYVYSEDLDNQTAGIDCTSGCNLQLDRTLGDVFYRFFFVDSNGKLVGKGPVTKIPGT